MKDQRTFNSRSHKVERWRVQKKQKEEEWTNKKRKKKGEEEEEGEEVVEKTPREDRQPLYDEQRRG